MNLAETIKNAREALGMTQEDLAEKLEVSRQAVSKWELGASVPSQENMKVLEEILGVQFPEAGKEAPEAAVSSIWGKIPLVWKIALLTLGVLMLAALISIGLYAALKPDAPKEASITGIHWFAEDGTPLRPGLGDGWNRFDPKSRILLAVSFQDGRKSEVTAVSVFLTPAGTETFDQREQLAVHAVEDGREFALFALDIPEDLMGHLEINLECSGGTDIAEMVNVTSIEP